MNISAIITYYNEEKILNTLEFIKRQSEILTEVILLILVHQIIHVILLIGL